MTTEDLRRGRLEQACPECGRWEAAGAYCSACYRPMGPGDWYRNGDESRRAVAHQKAVEKARTPLKGPRGRPRGQRPTEPLSGPELRVAFGDR
uniref:Uncharacterized protein n=1 Tax=viral metagenome TaxID=1070528 RepID=A0A6M3ITY7_9ZZZZ